MIIKPANRTTLVQEYYFSRKLAQIDKMRREGADVINLGIGSPDQPPSEETVNALCEEAKKPGSHGYQSYNGSPALRKAFSEWYKKYFRVDLDPENEILALMGSKEGIMHISMAFINPGDEVLVPDPGYPTYSSVTNLVGGKVRTYDLTRENNWYPDFDVLENSDLSKVKLMWVNYPHMPTGTKASPVLFERLVSFSKKHGILLINDNPYSFILNTDYQSILEIPGSIGTVMELNSLSKSHSMAGWRVGMLAGSSDYLKEVLKVKSNMDSGMFLGLQAAAIKALSNPDSWYVNVNAVYKSRRVIVEEIMNLLGCEYDRSQSGMFMWSRIPESITSCEEFIENILNKVQVFITPGFIFGKNGERYLRISLCANEKRLAEARDRLKTILN
ncbi:MAG TPA: aminotransferase class I/II-fold pyridoxal phosphate-dependent enzyme [Bacteroidales bacterium]|nr:aminotransferase class I/II-fold pyridoxal phosphate-dependent enzyme [Bacteroidales bacterium]